MYEPNDTPSDWTRVDETQGVATDEQLTKPAKTTCNNFRHKITSKYIFSCRFIVVQVHFQIIFSVGLCFAFVGWHCFYRLDCSWYSVTIDVAAVACFTTFIVPMSMFFDIPCWSWVWSELFLHLNHSLIRGESESCKTELFRRVYIRPTVQKYNFQNNYADSWSFLLCLLFNLVLYC